MQNVKIPVSDSYNEYLIDSLKDPAEAAGLIEAILEEKDPEPELLRNTLRKVIEAYRRSSHLSELAKQEYEKLDKILTESGGNEIYTFMELLRALGLDIGIIVQ